MFLLTFKWTALSWVKELAIKTAGVLRQTDLQMNEVLIVLSKGRRFKFSSFSEDSDFKIVNRDSFELAILLLTMHGFFILTILEQFSRKELVDNE